MPSNRRPPANAQPPAKRKRKNRPRVDKLKHPLPIGHSGRPPKYETGLDERAMNLALLGLTDEQIAHHFNIPTVTFYRWSAQHASFRNALDSGRLKADADVAASLFNRATGRVKMPAVKIFLSKDGDPVYAPYVEHFPPDVGAAKLWLTNRRPAEWRERKEVEVTGQLEHRLAQMTPEERLARLIELQAKAGQIIEGEAEEVEE